MGIGGIALQNEGVHKTEKRIFPCARFPALNGKFPIIDEI